MVGWLFSPNTFFWNIEVTKLLMVAEQYEIKFEISKILHPAKDIELFMIHNHISSLRYKYITSWRNHNFLCRWPLLQLILGWDSKHIGICSLPWLYGNPMFSVVVIQYMANTRLFFNCSLFCWFLCVGGGGGGGLFWVVWVSRAVFQISFPSCLVKIRLDWILELVLPNYL